MRKNRIFRKIIPLLLCLVMLNCIYVFASASASGAPGAANISHDNWDGDGDYTITMNMWWGNNGTSWTLYENNTAILTENLTDNSPNAQTVSKTFTNKPRGTYTYKCDLKNSYGTSTSSTITVTVNSAPPASDPGVGGTWGSKVFAPYVDVMLWPQFSLNDCYAKTAQKYYTLAFITADTNGNPAWGGVTPMSDNYYFSEIKDIRSKGGDVIISFGGANGTELASASANTDVSILQSKYQAVIDKYKVTWIDFDIEGALVADKTSTDRRNKAIKGLQDNNPNLKIAFCLPVLPSGLTADGLYVLENAKTNGVRVDVVNVMAMDYGDGQAPNPDGKMGDYAIQSATSTIAQCTKIGLSPKIGVTPMIGQNDVGSEVFYLTDAQKLLKWADGNSSIGLIAMWSSTRDNGTGGVNRQASPKYSGIAQSEFDFTNIFKAFK